MAWLGSRFLRGAALVATLLAPPVAAAQPTPSPLDIPAAPVVLTGRVASAASRWDAPTGTIVTYVAVDVAERLRGNGIPGRVVLKQLGGEVGGIGMWIADQATFRPAEDVLLFLSISPRDGTLHTTALSRGKQVLDPMTLPLVRAQIAAAPDGQSVQSSTYVAVPPEYDARQPGPLFTFLATGAEPARWHEVDANQPVFVDHPSSLPGSWSGSTANATAAINLWRGSGMDLDLRDGGAGLGNACPSTFTGNGRISVAYNDPCGLADSPEVWVIGGGYYTTGDLRIVNGTRFQKFLQAFVVLNNAGPQTSSAGCFQDAITHGLGHALGLGHSTTAGAMMAVLPSASCNTGPRGLAADDRAGVTAIYQGVATGPIPPLPPTGFTATAQLSTVTLSWTENPNGGPAQRHIAEAGNTVSGVYGLGSATLGPATTVAFGNVPPGTYFLRVRAQNAAGTSAPSNEAQVTVGACAPPGAPGTLSAATSGNNVSLQWSAPASGVTQGYLLATGSQPGASNLFVGALAATPTALGAPVPFGTYYSRIHATNVCGVGPPSNEVTIVVQPCSGPPQAPTNFRFTKAGSFVTLAWNAPVAGPPPSAYTLVVGSLPGTANLLVQSTGNTATSGAGLVPNGSYYVRMLSQNPCGQSGPSNEILVVVP